MPRSGLAEIGMFAWRDSPSTGLGFDAMNAGAEAPNRAPITYWQAPPSRPARLCYRVRHPGTTWSSNAR